MGLSVAETQVMLSGIKDPARRQAIIVQLSPQVRDQIEKANKVDNQSGPKVISHRPRWRYLLVPIRLAFYGFGMFYYYLGKGLLWMSMQLRRFIHGT